MIESHEACRIQCNNKESISGRNGRPWGESIEYDSKWLQAETVVRLTEEWTLYNLHAGWILLGSAMLMVQKKNEENRVLEKI